MKKLASLILALAMCLALGAPAFATETGNLNTDLISVLPELQITMPDSASIILNPYRMTTSETGTGIETGDRFQIMNPVFSIVSDTTSKVHVKATVTGSTGGNAEFSSTTVKEGAAGHSVYLQLWYAYSESDTTAVPYPDAATNPTNFKVIGSDDTVLEWDLPAKKTGSGAKSQRIDMQFSGTCSDSPTEDEGPWTDSDTVSAAFVFEVNPVTDVPMIKLGYQNVASGSTASDITFATAKPTSPEPKSGTFSIKSVKVGTQALTLVPANDKWTGELVTITATALGTNLNVTGKASYKTMEVVLQYEDKGNAGKMIEVPYIVKVLCYPVPSTT